MAKTQNQTSTRSEAAATVTAQIAALRSLTVGELRERFVEVSGEAPRTWNKQALFKRLAWKVQERVYGGLSERAKARAAELADETIVKSRARWAGLGEPVAAKAPARPRDPRLPAVGSVLIKEHRGTTYKVLVTEDGFEFGSAHFRSLSAIARAITNVQWNGMLFFHLVSRAKPAKARE